DRAGPRLAAQFGATAHPGHELSAVGEALSYGALPLRSSARYRVCLSLTEIPLGTIEPIHHQASVWRLGLSKWPSRALSPPRFRNGWPRPPGVDAPGWVC